MSRLPLQKLPAPDARLRKFVQSYALDVWYTHIDASIGAIWSGIPAEDDNRRDFCGSYDRAALLAADDGRQPRIDKNPAQIPSTANFRWGNSSALKALLSLRTQNRLDHDILNTPRGPALNGLTFATRNLPQPSDTSWTFNDRGSVVRAPGRSKRIVHVRHAKSHGEVVSGAIAYSYRSAGPGEIRLKTNILLLRHRSRGGSNKIPGPLGDLQIGGAWSK